jgi:hypothetical protein
VSAHIAVQLLTLVPAGLVLLLGAFIRLHMEKTAAGELLAAATLSSVGLPVAVASGAPMTAAWSAWGGWCIAFASATIAVRTVIAFAREPIAIGHRVGVHLTFTAIGLAFAIAGLIPAFVMVAFVPTLAIALGLAARPPSPRRLRQIGWTLVAATTFAASVLATGARLTPAPHPVLRQTPEITRPRNVLHFIFSLRKPRHPYPMRRASSEESFRAA